MLKFKKIIIVMISVGLIAGCKTVTTQTEQVENNSSSDNYDAAPRPKSETAKINAQLGMAYLEKKNVQRAKQKLLMAMEQGPGIPETWYSMAYFLEVTGNKDEANRYYKKSIEIAPGRGDAQNNYGTFLCRNGQYQESIKHFLLAVKAPDYLDPAAAYENAGLCAMKIPAYKQALAYFDQALLKDPARTLSLLKIAEVDVKLGDYKHAKKMLAQYTLVSEPSPESIRLHEIIAKKSG